MGRMTFHNGDGIDHTFLDGFIGGVCGRSAQRKLGNEARNRGYVCQNWDFCGAR